MGVSAAALAAANLIAAGATALVSWGMAGGLDPALPAGRIFLPGEVSAADGVAVATALIWREQLAAALRPHHPLCGGTLLTSPVAVTSVAAKAALFQATGAAAVDMESLSVARAALAQGLPFIAVRVIVDVASDALPEAVHELTDASGVRLGRLLGQLTRRPLEVLALARLTRRYLAANRALAAVARSGALAPQAVAGGSRAASLS